MTRGVVSHWCLDIAQCSSHAGSLELLTHVASSRAEVHRRLSQLFVIRKQMTVSSKHRTATAGVGNSRTIALEGRDVFPCEFARAFQISGVRVQCAATNLLRRRGDLDVIRAQNSRCGSVHPGKQPLTNAS